MAVCVIKVRRGMVAIFGYTKLEFVTLFYRIHKKNLPIWQVLFGFSQL
jgi:hypothetical protein